MHELLVYCLIIKHLLSSTEKQFFQNRKRQKYVEYPFLESPFHLSEDERFTKYRSMNGVEINHTTGEIQFFMTSWEKQHLFYAQVFTLFDLQDMLERSLSGAIFSLDPVDPDKRL
ncbi:MAG: hypothetical protein Q8R83_09580 [Legionellaceae bacterium]|nr:hypothetical protein [Legionellaceae bacterium]